MCAAPILMRLFGFLYNALRLRPLEQPPADQMHIHRNTLRYRLDRICEIAQLNMKDEQLKKQMILSIYCFDLFPKIQGMSHLSPRDIAAK